jgi:hypothetical protein
MRLSLVRPYFATHSRQARSTSSHKAPGATASSAASMPSSTQPAASESFFGGCPRNTVRACGQW